MNVIGYLLVCILTTAGPQCKILSKQFETYEQCNLEGTAIVEDLPKSVPNVISIEYKCEPLGEPV